MPSQEDYLDNLLKGIGNTEEEENSRKKSEEGVKDETLQDPQIDMSDMDDLLQSALEAQQRDIPETQQSQNTQNSETIHPEETSSMSEDEIDRLLQQSREQAGSTEQQKEPDTNENDDLIKMLENVDDESLSNVLDQMAPNTENAEEPEKEEKRGKRKSFFDRFKKKKAKNSKNSAADETEYESLSEDMTEPDSGETQTTADTQKMKDDDREALLPGAFPQSDPYLPLHIPFPLLPHIRSWSVADFCYNFPFLVSLSFCGFPIMQINSFSHLSFDFLPVYSLFFLLPAKYPPSSVVSFPLLYVLSDRFRRSAGIPHLHKFSAADTLLRPSHTVHMPYTNIPPFLHPGNQYVLSGIPVIHENRSPACNKEYI